VYKPDDRSPEFEAFSRPFGGQLDLRNRWVVIAELIPWDEIEREYAKGFQFYKGRRAKSVRFALGALIIKEKTKLSDEETGAHIQENVYMQYLLGQKEFTRRRLFEPSMMVHFRKRLGHVIPVLNEKLAVAYSKYLEELAKLEEEEARKNKKDDDQDGSGSGNRGKLVIDATAVPQDIRHPNDLGLLDDTRRKSEELIDFLYLELPDCQKPRTYRRKARQAYMRFVKQKKKTADLIRTARGKQLRYLKRNIRYIKEMLGYFENSPLTEDWKRDWELIQKIYEQQLELHRKKSLSLSGKILSFTQPHVRAIARGKAKGNFEFGAKMSLGVNEHGMVFVDRLQWEPYNECEDLKSQCEAYQRRFGRYPESVHADKIYWTRENRQYCKDHGIRLSAVALGRPLEDTEENRPMIRKLRKQLREDNAYRQRIEGKFGIGKRKYAWDCVKEKLAETSMTKIHLVSLVMNIDKILRDLIFVLIEMLSGNQSGLRSRHSVQAAL
jgi:hypothetical protein